MNTPSPGAAPRASVTAGAVVGGRFRVEHTVSEDALGAILAATDQKTGKTIALRMLPREALQTPAAADFLKAEVRNAASLPHKNLVASFGAGQDPQAGWYVAGEWVEGELLSKTVARRRAEGRGGMSLRGAIEVVQQICTALTAAHGKTVHGGVRPSVVWVAKSGRAKLGDLGITRAILRSAGAQAFGDSEQAWLAPEVKAGAEPDVRSDVFGLGALLYAMLTGRSPTEDFVPPSQAHPDAGATLDEVLLGCLAPTPASRIASPEDVRARLDAFLLDAPPAADDDFDEVGAQSELAIDVGMASVRPESAGLGATRGPSIPGAPRVPDARPKVGQRVAASEQFRASLPGGPAPLVSLPPPAEASEGRVSVGVDLGSLLARITENDAPRWMVVKDNLDHGPFSGRELVQSMLKGEILADHGLLNMDTGERRKVKEFVEFTEFLEQYRIRKSEADQQAALARSETVQKAGNAAKLLIALAVLAVVGVGVGIFILTRPDKTDERIADSNLADLYERGEINITGTAGILPPPPRNAGRRNGGGGHGGGGGGGGGGGMSYEEAMNQAVNLGDVSGGGGGGERQLTPNDVAGVMNRHINSLFSCVSAELRNGAGLSNVQIDLAIAGSGQVLGASTRQGSSAFQACIGSKARAIRFPTFPAPRMGARYSFSVD
jgi:serine/threonine protein kinase